MSYTDPFRPESALQRGARRPVREPWEELLKYSSMSMWPSVTRHLTDTQCQTPAVTWSGGCEGWKLNLYQNLMFFIPWIQDLYVLHLNPYLIPPLVWLSYKFKTTADISLSHFIQKNPSRAVWKCESSLNTFLLHQLFINSDLFPL